MVIGGILPGQAFKADRKSQDSLNRDWLHVIEFGGKPIDGWSAAWLLDYHENTTPPPVVTHADVPYTYEITLGDDITYEARKITGSGILKAKA